ncbi:hypothetical protein HT136_01720 [Novosphingobium profundi]|uniref:hypothetical protein n=1 Tax=Novosphingobium profundi TaxID=1774954 RepID=UPI001BDA9237|nr:hypothetical protein [Novosphingobium profundi]MBT0667085.1 hypothetical protein [Novosphingobium profundi]
MTTMTLYAARNIDFAPTINVDYSGDELPLIGATISMQVRQYAGAAGDPDAEDTGVTFTDGAHPTDPDLRRLVLEPSIAKADLAAMPGQNQPDPGDAQAFVHEFKITYADSGQDSLLSGDFILAAGVDAT